MPVDERSFMAPGGDRAHPSVHVNFRVHPGELRSLEVIFASRNFPFSTMSDMYRWAIRHAIEDLAAMEPMASSVIQQMQIMREIQIDEGFSARVEDTLDRLDEQVTQNIKKGRRNQNISLLHRHQAIIEAMPEGAWRDVWEAEFRLRFATHMTVDESRVAQLFGHDGN